MAKNHAKGKKTAKVAEAGTKSRDQALCIAATLDGPRNQPSAAFAANQNSAKKCRQIPT